MLPFDYRGRDWRTKNRYRQFFAEALLAVYAILLFPFTLLAFFLGSLWYFDRSRSLAR